MAKARTKSNSPFIGSWHVVSMSAWDEEYLNEEVQAFIESAAGGSGSFQFGYVQGQIVYPTGGAGERGGYAIAAIPAGVRPIAIATSASAIRASTEVG